MTRIVTAGPQYVLWNYTYYCNLNCQHCYSRAASYPSELDTATYIAIGSQLVELRVFTVALGGGEVLFRKDVTDIVRVLSDGGIHTIITTNGSPINANTTRKLKAAGLGELYVSIDSARAEMHDWFRRSQGSWSKATEAVRLASAEGIPTQLSCVLTKANVDEIGPIVSLATELGAHGVNFKRFRPAGNGALSREQFELPDEAIRRIEVELANYRRTSGLDLSLNFGAEIGEVDSGCACGITSLALRPNGDVALCSYAESILGNLKQQSLADIWQNSPILAAKRSGVTCEALHRQLSPSNPNLEGDSRDILQKM